MTLPRAAINLDAVLAQAAAHAALPSLVSLLDRRHHRQHAQLAGQVHDQLGSSLTALAMRLAVLERQDANAPGKEAAWNKARQLLATISQSARQVQQQLRPAPLETLGLEAALTEYLQQAAHGSAIDCKVERIGSALDWPASEATAVFCIVEEAITNIARHAGAKLLHVHLTHLPRQRSVTISDDGVGFDLQSVDWCQSVGLRLMHARATALGAQLLLDSAPGAGCRVTLIRAESA